jgi:hypothetical protein
VAPEAVSVAVPPGQIVAELTETFNDEPTFTFATSVPEQPLLKPVTVYEALLFGDTVMTDVVSPVLQLYELAPLAVSVAVPPGQIVVELTETFNEEPTLTFATSVPEQPLLKPVTV